MSPFATLRLGAALVAAAALGAVLIPAPPSGAQTAEYLPPAAGDVETVFVALPDDGRAASRALSAAQRRRLDQGWVVLSQTPWPNGDRAEGLLVTYVRR